MSIVIGEKKMQIAAGIFKAECLKLMDQVNKTHEEIIITKRGKPVAKMIPYSSRPEKNLFGYLKGTSEETGNIMDPIDVEWEANE